jgi:diguanylate cyclase (GGDEF)-like protein
MELNIGITYPRARAGDVRTRNSVRQRAIRRLVRHPAAPLTLALGVPGLLAAGVVGRLDTAAIALGAILVAAVAQVLVAWINRRLVHRSRRALELAQLAIVLVLAATLAQVVIPSSFALYIPVVGVAAAMGMREGLVIGLAAIGLYVLPILLRTGSPDPDQAARGVAAAAVCALVAGGARFFVGRLQTAAGDLREANGRERQRVRQIAGVEQVGRLLAAGPTSEALASVMDVLVERFGYRYVSIYLAREDGLLELGAQRGYTTTIDIFDGTYGVVGRVMRARRAELVADVSIDPDYAEANPNVMSEIAAPLIVGEEFLGIVNVEATGRALDQTDFRLVVAVTDQLAAYVALGRERQRLAELAITDGLTGLHNRRFLDDSIRRLFAARARQQADRRDGLAVILFDLDHFGALNKQHGHATGDEVLRRFGRLLAEQFREADIVARYGGEEFLVVLVGASLADAERRANELRIQLADQTAGDSDTTPITVSAGCAAIGPEDDAGDFSQLLTGADVALSLAKRSGRNRVVSAFA